MKLFLIELLSVVFIRFVERKNAKLCCGNFETNLQRWRTKGSDIERKLLCISNIIDRALLSRERFINFPFVLLPISSFRPVFCPAIFRNIVPFDDTFVLCIQPMQNVAYVFIWCLTQMLRFLSIDFIFFYVLSDFSAKLHALGSCRSRQQALRRNSIFVCTYYDIVRQPMCLT